MSLIGEMESAKSAVTEALRIIGHPRHHRLFQIQSELQTALTYIKSAIRKNDQLENDSVA